VNTFFAPYAIDLAPGEERSIAGRGSFFYVSEASDSFQIGIEDKSLFDAQLGISFNAVPGEFFHKIRLKNPLSSTVSVKVWVGNGSISDFRLNVIQGRNSSFIKTTPNNWGNMGVAANVNGSGGAMTLIFPGDSKAAYLMIWGAAALQIRPDAQTLVPGMPWAFTAPQRLDYSGPVYARASGAAATTAFAAAFYFGSDTTINQPTTGPLPG